MSYYTLRETFVSPMIVTIDTTIVAHSPSDTYRLPFIELSRDNIVIDWGDGSIESMVNLYGNDHVYSSIGIYDVSYLSRLQRIRIGQSLDLQKATTMKQWGNSMLTSCVSMFSDCSGMSFTYTDVPDTSMVTSMANMFFGAKLFNRDITFDTSNVISMNGMFGNIDNFNADVSLMDTSSLETADSMFSKCFSFNRSVLNFDTSKVTAFSQMFNQTYAFDQSVSNFDTSSAINMSWMFSNAHVFNQSVSSFSTSLVTDFSVMFNEARLFNQSVSNFDTSSAINMSSMFKRARVFNQDVSGWNTGNVEDMNQMFNDADVFNQNVSGWDTGSVENMFRMFYSANNFDQDISGWDISSLTNAEDMLGNTSFSQANYDALLIAWANKPHNNDVEFGAGAYYTLGGAAEAGRNTLLAHGWIITDNGGI